MTNAQHPVGAATVVGPGPLAHIAALRLARALPTARVTLVRTPLDPAALADRFPTTIPGNGDWPTAIGLSEPRLIAQGAATHRLGIRFEDWGEDRADWTFAHGDEVAIGATGALHQLWRAHGRTIASRYEQLVPGCAMAASGRFVDPPSDGGTLLAGIDYGVRLDRSRVLKALEAALRAAGIEAFDALTVSRSNDADGRYAGVTLDSGRVIDGNLFVDATGPRALLRPDAAVAAEPASPCTRLLIAERAGPPSPRDLIRATDSGWQAEWPLADRVVTMAGCAVRDRERVRQGFGETVEEVTLPPPAERPAMAANVMALGEAGHVLDPLGTLGFALALRQLDLFLELLPASRPDPRLTAELNRRTKLAAERIAAFVAALYHVRPRRAGAFWQECGRTDASDTLLHFAERGVLAHFDEESVSAHEWRVALLGLGVTPRVPDAIARSADAERVRALLGRLAARVASLPSELPPYPAYLSHLMRSAR